MSPYYSHAGITIYHGDCREILPAVTADVLVTDPPYGIEIGSFDQRGGKHSLAKGAYGIYLDTFENFQETVVPALRTALATVKRGAVFCGPRVYDLPPADAIGGIYCSAALGTHRWGFNNFLPILFYGKDPVQQSGGGRSACVYQSNARAEPSIHPVPKPLPWLKWLVKKASLDHEVVLDPFMGSGTTLVASKDLGRNAIGIELDERYCEEAAMRLGQETLNFEGAA